ncbi:unnamed protein product [Effrenium voratum]|nr:unnamed protein product [Effrenium voratum]
MVVVTVRFCEEGQVWSKAFDVASEAPVRQLKASMLSPNGSDEDIDSFELRRLGRRVPDFAKIFQDCELDFEYLGHHVGREKAYRDRADEHRWDSLQLPQQEPPARDRFRPPARMQARPAPAAQTKEEAFFRGQPAPRPAHATAKGPGPPPAKRWEVIGGADKGGILVREGQSTTSKQLADRLSTGALVEELDLRGERLQFKRLTGSGPETGWVSLSVSGKEIVKPRIPSPEEMLTLDKALSLQEELMEGFNKHREPNKLESVPVNAGKDTTDVFEEQQLGSSPRCPRQFVHPDLPAEPASETKLGNVNGWFLYSLPEFRTSDFTVAVVTPWAGQEVLEQDGPFTVELDKGSGSFGLSLDYEVKDRCLVLSVNGGAVAEWNTKNPDKLLQVGDCIMAVNGTTGSSESLFEAVKKADKRALRVSWAVLRSFTSLQGMEPCGRAARHWKGGRIHMIAFEWLPLWIFWFGYNSLITSMTTYLMLWYVEIDLENKALLFPGIGDSLPRRGVDNLGEYVFCLQNDVNVASWSLDLNFRGICVEFDNYNVLGVANYSCLLLCFVLVFGSMLAVLLSRGADLRTGKYLAGDGKCLEHPWRGSF